MSVLLQGGGIITVMETELECPICTFVFDASEKMDRAKYPMFKTKCPACKGKIGISMPIFGGTTECFEWDVPANVTGVKTIAPFMVNGNVVIAKLYDDNSDEESEIMA